jgi:hypothetical protein
VAPRFFLDRLRCWVGLGPSWTREDKAVTVEEGNSDVGPAGRVETPTRVYTLVIP